jgi:hypothetical protein
MIYLALLVIFKTFYRFYIVEFFGVKVNNFKTKGLTNL